jgi:hypothetical protein
VIETRIAHTHPERGALPPPVAPRRLSVMINQLKTSIENLDSDTLRIQPPKEHQALKDIYVGLVQITNDRLPNAAALRSRDLHYAGYYREIQFGRLAKESGLFDNFGKSPDPRRLDINRSIFDADNLAHKFHTLRTGPDDLPMSVVAPNHRDRVPGRLLSELLRELRYEYQKPGERLAELNNADEARRREQYRNAVHGLADTYASITSDPKAAGLIWDYVQRHRPRLDQETIDAMRDALRVAATFDGNYQAVPDVIRNQCMDMCLALDIQGDSRLFGIIDQADKLARDEPEQTQDIEQKLRPKLKL